jgi:hypothetical protein
MQGSGGVRGYLFYPTLVGHIHLDKRLINNSFSLRLLYMKYTWAFWARPDPARRPGPGPAHARPAHEPYSTGVGRDLEAREICFLARARPEMLFLVVLHYQCAGGPPKPGPGPSPARKLRPDASSGMVIGRIFSSRNNINFFQPGPNPARTEKCPGLIWRLIILFNLFNSDCVHIYANNLIQIHKTARVNS